eukprot:TRINITY_DN2223_c0_g1_i5.p3 TRINITY_DN2223_c0_g1~~TRINITY_DN2223_c0_g1_i5.p3  ORF type:complete len:121 (-),score=33.42 TRINITY_DN2223_c0_g1_i5:151-513(-)
MFYYCVLFFFFFFKQKTAYDISACLVGSEMCIRDSLYFFYSFNILEALTKEIENIMGILEARMPNIEKEVSPDKITKLKTYWQATKKYIEQKKALLNQESKQESEEPKEETEDNLSLIHI